MKQTTNVTRSLLVALLVVLAASVVVAEVSTQDHTADVDLEPEYSQSGQSIEYDYNLTRTSGDPIQQVTIYKNPTYSSFSCEPVPGWELVTLSDIAQPGSGPYAGQGTDVCYWFAQVNQNDSTGFETVGSSKVFKFNATTPSDLEAEDRCELPWYVQTVDSYPGDNTGQAQLNHDTTSIDDEAPVASHVINNPKLEQYGHTYILPNETDVTLLGSDEGESQCQSGIDFCEWKYTRTYVDENGDVQVDDTYDSWMLEEANGESVYAWNETFPVDSNHTVTVRCTDVLGLESDEHTFSFIVDGTAPNTTAEVTEPKHWATYEETGQLALWLDSVNNITFDATDNKFNRGNVTTQYQHYYYPEEEDWYHCYEGDNVLRDEITKSTEGKPWVEHNEEFTLNGFNESCNVIVYKSYDPLSNTEENNFLRFFVDKTPPAMEKTVSEDTIPHLCGLDREDVAQNWTGVDFSVGHKGDFDVDMTRTFSCDGVTIDVELDTENNDAITASGMQVVLTNGGEPIALVGVNSAEFSGEPFLKTWSSGWSAPAVLPAGVTVDGRSEDTAFSIYVPLSVLDSLLDGSSVLGWAVNAEVTAPGVISSSSSQKNFPADWSRWTAVGEYEETLNFFATTDSEVTLSCEDYGPHPAYGETAFWTIERTTDGQTWETIDESSAEGGVNFSFADPSLHRLSWYCVDAVNKQSETDVEYFKVDDEPPVLDKVLDGPHAGADCPADSDMLPENGDVDAECYLLGGETAINLSVSDYMEGGAAVHYSNAVTCDWSVEYDGDTEFMTGSFSEGEVEQLVFQEDSEHILTVTCTDLVGNEMVDVERFLVDMKPPTTTKTYGHPNVRVWMPIQIGDVAKDIQVPMNDYRWITSDTPIDLVAEDEKVGVKTLYYNWSWVSNQTCAAHSHLVSDVGVDTVLEDDINWIEVDGNSTTFTIPQTSCHIIRYYAEDEFGQRIDGYEYQYVMVDNEAPEFEKMVGEPSIFIGEGGDAVCEDDVQVSSKFGEFDLSSTATGYESFVYTTGDILFFGYSDGTDVEIFDDSDVSVFSDTINEGEYTFADLPEGIYRTVGSERYSVLTGDPISNGCAGYYARDQFGLGASTDVYTHTGVLNCAENFVVFSYDEDNAVTIYDASTDAVIASTQLDEGEYWTSTSLSQRHVRVTSDDPVTTLVANDQGFEVPAEDGSFSGQLFYTVQARSNADVNVFAYENSTNVTIRNLDTDAVLGSVMLDDGESYSLNVGEGTYVKVESDKDVTVSVAPLRSRTNNYAHLTYMSDEDGSGIGLDILTQAISGGYVWVFGYADDTTVNVYNQDSETLLNTYEIDQGEAVQVSGGNAVHRIVADKGVSVLSGYAEYGASFAPVAFGDNVCLDADSDGICDSVDNCPLDYNPGQEDVCPDDNETEPPVCDNGGLDWYVTQGTPISLSCDDVLPHPVGNETLVFKVSYEGDSRDGPVDYFTERYCDEFGGDYDNVSETCTIAAVDGEAFLEFNFLEDSIHNLEAWCVDGLGNENEIDIEWFAVDTLAPETELDITGPYFENSDGIVWTDTATRYELPAQDQDPHPSGLNATYYKWYLVEDDHCWGNYSNDVVDTVESAGSWNLYEGEFAIPEQSCHRIKFYSVDNLGNTEDVQVEHVFVDKTPPMIVKTYEGPFFVEERFNESRNESYWAKFIHPDDTNVLVSVEDVGPHPSGLDEAEYRITRVDDEYCRYYDEFSPNAISAQLDARPAISWTCDAEGSGEWTSFDGELNVTVGEDSCHVIEVRAVDRVNKSSEHTQCVFVDGQAPETAKVVGEPSNPMSEFDIEWGQVWYGENTSFASPLTQEYCDADPMHCLEVTLGTPIQLACDDPEPHPSGVEGVYFQVHWDGDDVTEEYCELGNITGDGYCYVEGGDEGLFQFDKESWHRLDYYCADEVGNVGEHDIEYFKVEGDSFELTFNKKWNLVSTPVNLQDDALPTMFEEHADKVEAVWTYHDGTWYVYSPHNPDAANTLSTMTPGWGYWVLANEDFNLTIGGSLMSPGPFGPNSKTVVSNAWNLIGYYGMENLDGYYGPMGNGKDVQCALDTLRGDYMENIAPSLWTYWEPDNPNAWMPLDQFDDRMDPGAGYWLFYPQDVNGGYAVSSCPNQVEV